MVSVSVKVSLPKSDAFQSKKWLEEISRVQRQTSVPRLKKLFQQTVFGWSAAKKPDFGWAQQRTSDEMSISIYPTGAAAGTWELVNAGSPAHIISPRRGGFLRFRPGYRSATTAGSIQSRRAYRSGQFVGARIVHHPGFEARKFTELIAQEYENPYMNDMQGALNKIARS